MNTSRTRYLNAALVALGLSLTGLPSAHAQLGSAPLTQQEIWQRAKFPWLYPTAPAQNDSASAPAMSQQEMWKRAKFPWLYPASATDTGPICPGAHYAPGSVEARMAEKTPWLLPHRECVKSDS